MMAISFIEKLSILNDLKKNKKEEAILLVIENKLKILKTRLSKLKDEDEEKELLERLSEEIIKTQHLIKTIKSKRTRDNYIREKNILEREFWSFY